VDQLRQVVSASAGAAMEAGRGRRSRGSRPRSLGIPSADRPLQTLSGTGRVALLKELDATGQELAEVKTALRCGRCFLGMSGKLLQEYALEAAKKENLLRCALSQACPSGRRITRSVSHRRSVGAAVDLCSTAKTRVPKDVLYLDRQQRGTQGSQVPQSFPLSQADAKPSAKLDPPWELAAEEAADTEAEPEAEAEIEAESTASATPPTAHVSEAKVSEVTVSAAEPERAAAEASARLPLLPTAPVLVVQLPPENLAAVLQLLEAQPFAEYVQRAGLHAIRRFALDAAQLRPLCLAAAMAVGRAAATFRSSLAMQRLAVAALSSVAYAADVAALVAQEALPTIFAAVVAYAADSKLQTLSCEAIARLSQAAKPAVVRASVQTMLGHTDGATALNVCCSVLVRLWQSGICWDSLILDVLVPLSESQPDNLELQQRAATCLQRLVTAGTVDAAAARQRAASLLSAQWVHILARFAGAQGEEDHLNSRFHEDVQALFHQEVARHFEYEAAERSFHMVKKGASGQDRLLEVLRCLADNLQDYEGRLDARELAWDSKARCLVPLGTELKQRLAQEALESMECAMMIALRHAAPEPSSDSMARLAARQVQLRAECAVLLERKTDVTQAHQERAAELRREVMLFEAVEYLELQGGTASVTQVRTALHMLDEAAHLTPSDATERLRARLNRIAAGHGASQFPDVGSGQGAIIAV